MQAKKKIILPAIAQKLPTLETIKHKDETINNSQPIMFRNLLFIPRIHNLSVHLSLPLITAVSIFQTFQ